MSVFYLILLVMSLSYLISRCKSDVEMYFISRCKSDVEMYLISRCKSDVEMYLISRCKSDVEMALSLHYLLSRALFVSSLVL